MKQEYWFYHNWTVVAGGRVTIHKAECSFCQGGRGVHHVLADTGEWFGPMPLKEARKEAKKLKTSFVKDCSFCMKN